LFFGFSVHSAACFFLGARLLGWFWVFGLGYGAAHFFWVRHSAIAVLSARGYHGVLLQHLFYA
jgi:hypothetical protein